MKKVHAASMVAHLWANQSQDDARTATQNFWFCGAKLYSYGGHYVVGYLSDWNTSDGKRVVLRNASRYSNTTAKHNSEASYALRGHNVEQFWLGELTDSMLGSRTMARDVCDQCEADINAALERASGFRSTGKINVELNAAIDARRLMFFIMDDSATDKDDRKAIAKQIKRLPEIPRESTREAMKPLRDELEKARAIKAMERYAGLCRDRLANVLGWCDANGFAVPALNVTASSSIYIRRAFDAHASACTALDDRQRATSYAKKAGKRLPSLPSEKVIRDVIATLAPCAKYEAHEQETRNAAQHIATYYRERAGLVPYRWNTTTADNKARAAINIAHESALALRDGDLRDLDDYAPEHLARLETFHALRAKGQRAKAIDTVIREIEHIWRETETAASLLPQLERDAANHYRRAIAGHRRAVAAINAMHERGESANAQRWLNSRLPDGSIAAAGAWLEQWTAKEAERNAAKIAEWRAGQHSATAIRDASEWPLLRVNVEAERIESSWGAQMPVAHARAVWLAIRQAQRKGEDWTSPPNESVKMGSFTLTRARVDGSIVAGCHDIPASEINAIVAALGLAD